jgi:hypothetical protein
VFKKKKEWLTKKKYYQEMNIKPYFLILKEEGIVHTSTKKLIDIRSLNPKQIHTSIISPSKEIPEVLERSKKRKRFIILPMLTL